MITIESRVVHTQTVLRRLAELNPDAYGEWSFRDLAAALAEEEIRPVKIRGTMFVRAADVLRALPQRKAGWVIRLTDRTYGQEWESADEGGRRKLMLNAGMTLKIMHSKHFGLTIPATTMRAGYPGWEPHLSPADVAYIAGDSGAMVHVAATNIPAENVDLP